MSVCLVIHTGSSNVLCPQDCAAQRLYIHRLFVSIGIYMFSKRCFTANYSCRTSAMGGVASNSHWGLSLIHPPFYLSMHLNAFHYRVHT